MQVTIEYKLAANDTKASIWTGSAFGFDDARARFSDFLKFIGLESALVFSMRSDNGAGATQAHEWQAGIEILASE